jgi:hypothetical protein
MMEAGFRLKNVAETIFQLGRAGVITAAGVASGRGLP